MHTHTTTPPAARALAASIQARASRVGGAYRGIAHTADPDVRKARKAELRALSQEARELARLI